MELCSDPTWQKAWWFRTEHWALTPQVPGAEQGLTHWDPEQTLSMGHSLLVTHWAFRQPPVLMSRRNPLGQRHTGKCPEVLQMALGPHDEI